MQNKASTIVVLGTGGTIAGTSTSPADDFGYTAAQIGVTELIAAVPELAGQRIECEQVAQIDSKDMDFAVWLALARRVAQHLSRADVAGVVITHGTDTLEETAYFLHRVLAPTKPVVLTAAMKPATSAHADGPANMRDAVFVARNSHTRGVVVVMAGHVHAAAHVRKAHSHRADAFESGDEGPVAVLDKEGLKVLSSWPQGDALGLTRLHTDPQQWPRVEIVTSHAGATGASVRALCADGTQGIVVAATGAGTVHHVLEAALLDAQRQGIRVMRSSRCANGRVLGKPDDVLPSAGELTPVKARIELMLQLMR